MKIRCFVLFIMLWLLSSSAFSSSTSDSDYRMVLLDYNSERSNETISFIEMAKNEGVFTLKGESKPFFMGFYRYYDRYMRYLDAKGNLVSISSIDGN
ncbi:MAG: hypothetical protein LWY06_07385, partial [Firmicutes bacterium]|nr:hypothetical protein [Bacillota bacterium]